MLHMMDHGDGSNQHDRCNYLVHIPHSHCARSVSQFTGRSVMIFRVPVTRLHDFYLLVKAVVHGDDNEGPDQQAAVA